MKIKIEIDVPKYVGGTDCTECPFSNNKLCYAIMKEICDNVDFSRMEVKELEENNERRNTN